MFDKIVALFRGNSSPPAAGSTNNGTPVVPACDLSGVIWTRLSTGAGGIAITGNTPGADGIGPAGLNALDERSYNYGFNGVSWDRLRSITDNGDAQSALTLGLLASISRNQVWNENGWDRQRGNTEFSVLPSAVRSATTNSADITSYNFKGILIFLNVTAVPGAVSISPQIQLKDPVSGTYFSCTGMTATTATGLFVYSIYPSATAAGYGLTSVTNGLLSRTFRISILHSGAGNFTYSVGASMLL